MYSRKCIVSGLILPINQLIRFVLAKNGQILLQKDKKIFGRGAYCKKDIDSINILFEKKLLNKSFKKNIDPKIYKELRKEVDEYVKK